jgi:hypothetical protein
MKNETGNINKDEAIKFLLSIKERRNDNVIFP